MQGVFDARLLFFHFHFGRSADPHHGDTADQLGETLLQLLAIVIAGGLLDLRTNLVDAAFDVAFLTGTIDDRGVVLVDDDALGASEIIDRDALELDAELFGDHTTTGENRDVFQHRLAAVPEAGSLHRSAL